MDPWVLLYGAEIALKAKLLSILPFRRYPAFGAYLGFGLLTNIALFSLWQDGRMSLYAQVWLWKRCLGIVTIGALGLELLCPKYRKFWPIALIPALYLLAHFSLSLDQKLQVIGPVIVILAYAHKKPIGAGLLVSTLFPVMAESSRAILHAPAIQYVPMVCHAVALAMWLRVFSRTESERALRAA